MTTWTQGITPTTQTSAEQNTIFESYLIASNNYTDNEISSVTTQYKSMILIIFTCILIFLGYRIAYFYLLSNEEQEQTRNKSILTIFTPYPSIILSAISIIIMVFVMIKY